MGVGGNWNETREFDYHRLPTSKVYSLKWEGFFLQVLFFRWKILVMGARGLPTLGLDHGLG